MQSLLLAPLLFDTGEQQAELCSSDERDRVSVKALCLDVGRSFGHVGLQLLP